jgi:hypothetical protein
MRCNEVQRTLFANESSQDFTIQSYSKQAAQFYRQDYPRRAFAAALCINCPGTAVNRRFGLVLSEGLELSIISRSRGVTLAHEAQLLPSNLTTQAREGPDQSRDDAEQKARG